MSERMRIVFQVFVFLFYFNAFTIAQNCDDGIEVEIKDQDIYCAKNNSIINITVATPDIELECPSGYDIDLDTANTGSTQLGKNTVLDGRRLRIQVLRYGHKGMYRCVSSMSDERISIEIQATGVGMIIRDRIQNTDIEFHQVVNNSIVYLSCEKDFGILFICESSYRDERFALISSGVFSPIETPVNANEFEILHNGVLNGDETILTCQPKDELGIVQNITVTVKVTERLPNDNCDGIFPRTSQPSENTACILELGTDPAPVIRCTDCSSDWIKLDGVCYKDFNTNFNWSGAQANCASEGGYLAEIPNYYVNKIVNNIANGRNCWIGLREYINGEYEWISGRKVDESEFSAWKDGTIGTGSGNCGVMSSNIGEWELKVCQETLQCSICMKGTIYPPPFPEPQETCNNGVVIAERCYQHFATALPWQFAQWECELLGSNLIEIPDQNVSKIIPLNMSGESWIGLRRANGTADFKWRSGYALDDYGFSSWSDGYPGSMHECVSTNHDGMWQAKPCNDMLGYICQNGTFNVTSIIIHTTSMVYHISTNILPSSTISSIVFTTVTDIQIPQATIAQPMETPGLSTPTMPAKSLRIDITIEDCNLAEAVDNNRTIEERCRNILENQDIFSDIDSKIFDDEFDDTSLLNLLNTPSLNISQAIRTEINDTSLILARFAKSAASSLALTPNINISTSANTFQGAASLVALVIGSNSDAIRRTLTDMDQMGFISDICTVVTNSALSGKISIIFSYNSSLYSNFSISCNFYDNTTSAWSPEGILTKFRSEGTIECVADHLTSFALLVTFQTSTNSSSVNDLERTIQGYLSMGLCVVSLILLLASLVLYACVGKKFFSRDLNIIHLNYIFALIFALISFLIYSILFAASKEILYSNIGCKAIAFVNHYFWLSVFSWNFCEALHIILALYSYKLPNMRHYWWLIIIGWGFPVPIVIITLGVAFNYYTNMRENICFLNKEGGVILAFLAPIYFIILVNSCILIFVVVMTVYVQRKRRHKRYICSLICGTATTLPLLGLPWVAGILPNLSGLLQNDNVAWLTYIFITLNASQGILFFCIHVVRNDQVLDKLYNLSQPETHEEVENKSPNQEINADENARKKISKGMRTPDDFSNTTEAANYMTHDSSKFLSEKIADLPSNIAIENPTYANNISAN